MLPTRWLVFVVLFLARTTIAYQFQSVASIGPALPELLGIDYATIGVLIGCYMLPGVVLALPGGVLNQRFGSKRILILGLLLMSIGAVLMVPGSALFLFAGRLTSGAGAAILNVVLARTVADWFEEHELAGVMGTFVASWPLGVALSLVSVPSAALALGGWGPVMILSAIPSLLCLLVLSAGYRDPPRHASLHAPSAPGALPFREALIATTAGAIWGLYNVSYVVFVAALPEFFTERGYSLAEAAALASVLGWVLIASLPLGGYLSQRIGHGSLVMIGCFLIIAGSAVSLAVTSATALSLTVLAATVGLPAGLIMALPAQALAPERRAIGTGIYFTVFYVSMATLPGVAGLVRQYTADPASPLIFGAGTIALAALAVIYLRWLRQARPGGRRDMQGGIAPPM